MDQLICPNCKTANPTQNMFCQSCGTRLTGPEVPPPAPFAAASMPPAQAAYPPPPAQGAYPPPQGAYPPPPQGAYPPPQQGAYPPPGNYPPPQGAYPPPGYAAPRPQSFAGPSIDSLGVRMDGELDVFEDDADLADGLAVKLGEALKAQQFPQTTVNKMDIMGAGGKKTYHLVQRSNGATIAAFVYPSGKDLVAGWTLFYKPPLKVVPLAILAGIDVGVALLLALIFGSYTFLSFVYSFISNILTLIPAVVLGAMVAGKVLKGYKWHFITGGISNGEYEDMGVLASKVANTLDGILQEEEK
jgi:hypothetical protein